MFGSRPLQLDGFEFENWTQEAMYILWQEIKGQMCFKSAYKLKLANMYRFAQEHNEV